MQMPSLIRQARTVRSYDPEKRSPSLADRARRASASAGAHAICMMQARCSEIGGPMRRDAPHGAGRAAQSAPGGGGMDVPRENERGDVPRAEFAAVSAQRADTLPCGCRPGGERDISEMLVW
jgi:hypothetical protein